MELLFVTASALSIVVFVSALGWLAVWATRSFLFPWLAEENILFATVREGTVKAIMRGKSFERFIMSFKGYHLNDPAKDWFITSVTLEVPNGPGQQVEKTFKIPEWEILYHGIGSKYKFDETDDDAYDDRPKWQKELGLYWVGWPWSNSIYVYQFEWNEPHTDPVTGKETILSRAEATDFAYVSDFTYAIVTNSAETADLLPVDVLTYVTLAIRNAYRALFSGEDWIQRITATINRHVRGFVGNKEYKGLISIAKADEGARDGAAKSGAREFSSPIILLNDYLPDEDEQTPPPHGVHQRYGVEIRTGDLQTIELAGDEEQKRKHQEAAATKYTAQQKADATRIEADAEGYAIETVGKKEAESLQARLAVVREHGESALVLAQVDAIKEAAKGAGNTVIWANNPFVPLADAIRSKPKGAANE